MPPHTYEITFIGQADRTLRAQFDDCKVTLGPSTSTLRTDLPDQAALCGLVQRIAGLGLEIIHLRLLAPPVPITGRAQAGQASSDAAVGRVPFSLPPQAQNGAT